MPRLTQSRDLRTNFGRVDRVALFGGTLLMATLCRRLVCRDLDLMLFAAPRHLDAPLGKDRETLRALIARLGIPICSTQDINLEPALSDYLTPSTLGLSLGAAWVFNTDTVKLFDGKLLDFMGIPLPEYRGGAHYTWQILRLDKRGGCSLQIIHGGTETLHKGEIIKRLEYAFPASVRIPQDYFDAAIPLEVSFLEGFFDDLAANRDFEPMDLDESHSTFFPFLHTPRHGLIDWCWGSEEIERFICAFDDPYPGASTFMEGRKVWLKNCHATQGDAAYHPFLSGLVYRELGGVLHVATRDGTLVVGSIIDERGKSLMAGMQGGQRLYTPQWAIDEARQFGAVYDAKGIRDTGQGSRKRRWSDI